MKFKCNYCRKEIDIAQTSCPYCGAENDYYNSPVSEHVPETIEEFKNWYKAMNLPDEEKTRFFIGKNYTSPKAFGIFKDLNNEFTVYKNKADGTRVIRYKGPDENVAVKELFERLKEEIGLQKAKNRKKDKTKKKRYSHFNHSYGNTING